MPGKKIFLSIGGAGNSLPLTSDQGAISFANRVWELFGPVAKIDPGLRLFGTAVLDGFDLSMPPFLTSPPKPLSTPTNKAPMRVTDKQGDCAAHYDTFAATLRAHFAADPSKKDYFLSTAPGCAYPDMSVHPGYLAQGNFVWPRFFNDSVRTWVGDR